MACSETKENRLFHQIAINMKSKSNPIRNVTQSEWECVVEWLMDEYEFNKHFVTDNPQCVASGGQAKVYLYEPRNITIENAKTVVKVYNLKYGEAEIKRIWREFVLIKESTLLHYGSMFYHRKNQQIMITSEPLECTLKEHIYRKQRLLSSKEVSMDSIPSITISSEFECKIIALEILDKLHTLHRCGYIHCDLKPSNIMKRDVQRSVHGKGKKKDIGNGWKIIDFGAMLSAKECLKTHGADGKKYVFRYRGTVHWTAPELDIESKNNRFSFAVDIWSLGLLILFILFGKQPYVLSEYESNRVCRTRLERKQYFYRHKLWRKGVKWRNGRLCFVEGKKNNINEGQVFISNYLVKLYYANQISKELFDLLHDDLLQFDPRRRKSTQEIYKHRWFDEIRDL